MKKRNWALVILLIALVASAIFLNLWTPPDVARQQQQEQKDSTPFTEQKMIQRVRQAYNSLDRAREDLKRRGEEARAKSAEPAAH
ncbi:MAG TPA: hypothetical protein VKB51_19125 [bacterium]|nr:hypothetical protein [bacterium]